jgi:hypothetical protein
MPLEIAVFALNLSPNPEQFVSQSATIYQELHKIVFSLDLQGFLSAISFDA